jgi:hypothetical protein
MKNRIIALLVLVFSATGLYAQVKFGIRGGINSSNIQIKDFDNDLYTLEYARGSLGFHIGGMAQIKLLGVFIQPELLFTTAKNDVSVAVFDNGTVSWSQPKYGSQRFNKIDIPLIAGVKLGPIKLQAGPVATMMLGSKSKLLDQNNIEQEFSGATFGYQVGAGIELASLLVDVKYEGNLSKLGDGIMIGGNPYYFDQRMNQWILSVGFLFGK